MVFMLKEKAEVCAVKEWLLCVSRAYGSMDVDGDFCALVLEGVFSFSCSEILKKIVYVIDVLEIRVVGEIVFVL